jgi:RNA polymerase sigma-70 factor (ECF subfamily)
VTLTGDPAFPEDRGRTPRDVEQLFRENVRCLHRYLRAFGVDSDTADDIIGDAFLAVWVKWPRLDPDGSPRAYLYAVATNRLRELMKRKGREWDWSAGVPVPEDTAADHDRSIDLDRAMRTLPVRQREAVLLYYYVGLAVAEVAGVMRIGPGTVMRYLYEARIRLAPLLRDPPPDAEGERG